MHYDLPMLRCVPISLGPPIFSLHLISHFPAIKQLTSSFFLSFPQSKKIKKMTWEKIFSNWTYKVRLLLPSFPSDFSYESAIELHRLISNVIARILILYVCAVFDIFPQPSSFVLSTCLVLWVSLFLINGFRASSPKSNFEPSNPK